MVLFFGRQSRPRNFAGAVALVLGDAVHIVGGSRTTESSHAPMGSAILARYHLRRMDTGNAR